MPFRDATTKYPFQHHLLPLFGLRRGAHLPREGHETVIALNGRAYFIVPVGSVMLQHTKARKPHRIFGQCFNCGGFHPAGKLNQHEPACKRTDAGAFLQNAGVRK